MQTLDWAIIIVFLLVLLAGAVYTKQYATSVSAFLAAERCGRRYLIAMASAMAGMGVITLVGWFEMYYEAGFTGFWWGSLTDPALIVIALSGWVVYRFRQTRAMTVAQFFEARYSRNFRVFSGLVAYLAGIINFGIFPAVGARFFIAICGLPEVVSVAGIEVSMFALVMAFLLSVALLFTFLGGQIAVMVTDFLQGSFANLVFAAVMIYLLMTFSGQQIEEALLTAETGRSMVDPMKMAQQEEFDLFYYLIAVVVVLYTVMGWQGTAGYNCCAVDAHEAKMAKILEGWRYRVLLLIAIVVPIAVYTMVHHPDFAEQAGQLQARLAEVSGTDVDETATLQKQLRFPHALAILLPTGLMGLFVAAMLAAFISTHDTYLHSWGAIFVQDVILPFRKRPFSPRQHLWLLRASIFGVAVFIYIFSLLYRPTQFVMMFMAVSGAVFVAGAGAVLIGGLYWRRGSTAGAWGAMVTGMTLSILGIVVKQLTPGQIEGLREASEALYGIAVFLKDEVTGQEMTFIAILCSIAAYVGLSLLCPDEEADFDRLLHRGEYAVAGESAVTWAESRTWLERLGVDREFTGWDRVVTLISIGWPLVWSAVILGGTLYATQVEIPESSWAAFWRAWVWVVLAAMIAVSVWFTIGGFRDLRFLFRTLTARRADPTDDGRVIENAPVDS